MAAEENDTSVINSFYQHYGEPTTYFQKVSEQAKEAAAAYARDPAALYQHLGHMTTAGGFHAKATLMPGDEAVLTDKGSEWGPVVVSYSRGE